MLNEDGSTPITSLPAVPTAYTSISFSRFTFHRITHHVSFITPTVHLANPLPYAYRAPPYGKVVIIVVQVAPATPPPFTPLARIYARWSSPANNRAVC